MSLVISNPELSVDVNTLVGSSPIPLTLELPKHSPPTASLLIAIADFDFKLSAPLVDYTPTLESGEITLRAVVDDNVVALLTLTGELKRGTSMFETESFSFGVEITKQESRALFVASTLMAMLGITGEMDIKIEGLGLGQKVTFDASLLITSGRLEQRLLAYRLMVIEAATRKTFVIPKFITRDDLGTIAFVYHAIVDRAFVWPNTYVFEGSVHANSAGRAQASIEKPTSLKFDSVPQIRTLFDQRISLGHASIIVDDAIAQNAEKVNRELEADDGHEVKFALRSLSGKARYEFHEAPRFDSQWSPQIQTLINLEPSLDAGLVSRYNELAAATLAGLSENEKREITARPEFDASSFVIEE